MCITGTVAGVTGPRTQQHAGKSNSDNRITRSVATIAIGFHGSGRGIITNVARFPTNNLRKSLFTALVVLATSASAAPVDVVRSNFISFYTAADTDRSSPRMQDALRSLE